MSEQLLLIGSRHRCGRCGAPHECDAEACKLGEDMVCPRCYPTLPHSVYFVNAWHRGDPAAKRLAEKAARVNAGAGYAAMPHHRQLNGGAGGALDR